MSYKLLLFTFLLTIQPVFSQDVDSLDLMDSSDVNVLLEEEKGKIESQNLDLSDLEEQDDLQTLKNDIGDVIFDDDPKKKKKEQGILEEKVSNELDELDKIEEEPEIVIDSKNSEIKILNDQETVANQDGDVLKEEGTEIFDVGPEEKELLRVHRGRVDELIVDDTEGLAGLVKNEKIPNSTGDEINYRLNNDDRQEAYSMQDEQERGYGNSEQHFEENHGKDIMQRSNQPYSSSTQAEENDKMRNLYRSE